MEKEVMEAAKKFGVEDRVKLIGPATEEEKYWYYKNCEAFLFPSYAEGFGLPVIEAMYHGKPVFISDKTSLPEVGGDAAYYFRNFEPEYMQEVFKEGMRDYAC
jgi:glycosyltransferase involved in cell wall biosynthesis